MSTYYCSTAIIGCQVNPKELWEGFIVQSCDHKERIGVSFCPVCGKKSEERTGYKRRFGMDKDDYKYLSESDYEKSDLGYSAQEKDFAIEGEHNPVVGFVITKGPKWGTKDHAFIALNDNNLMDLKSRTKKILKPLGLWNEESFGLYSILTIS